MENSRKRFTSSDQLSTKFVSHTRVMSQTYMKPVIKNTSFALHTNTQNKSYNTGSLLRKSGKNAKNKTKDLNSFDKIFEDMKEKNKYLLAKLNLELASKNHKKSEFQIYSDIFSEVIEILPQFRSILETLKKGLVLAAFKELGKDGFEFQEEINKSQQGIFKTLEKETKEKNLLIVKLNKISDELERFKIEYEDMKVSYLKYKKVVENDTQKYIDANYLVQKMMNQCSIISTQNEYIKVLKQLVPNPNSNNPIQCNNNLTDPPSKS